VVVDQGQVNGVTRVHYGLLAGKLEWRDDEPVEIVDKLAG